MSRPQASWADIANVGSNLYQNKQLANQSRALEQQNQMMQQQLLMQQIEQMNRELLVEKRKMLMRLHMFLDKVDRTHPHFPEYSWMMLDIVNDQNEIAGLSASDFEEVADMEKANQIQTRIYDTKTLILSNLSHERQNYAARMKSIVMSEEDELERLEYLLEGFENWNEVSPQYEEIKPIHERNKKSAIKAWAIGLVIALVLLGGGVGLLGECVEYDGDDVCVTYENDGSIVAGVFFGLGFITFIATLIIGIPKSIAVTKSGKIYNPLSVQFEFISSQSLERDSLSSKHSISNSQDAGQMRTSLVNWVDSMSPKDPNFLLEL